MLYRTIKPLVVDAIQANQPTAVRTAYGGTLRVKPGEWIVRDAEGGVFRCDDSTFKCTYESLDDRPLEQVEGKPYGC
jgi:hypothetical protein